MFIFVLFIEQEIFQNFKITTARATLSTIDLDYKVWQFHVEQIRFTHFEYKDFKNRIRRASDVSDDGSRSQFGLNFV